MEYHRITFRKDEYNVKKQVQGRKVGDLAVAVDRNRWKIYELSTGKAFVPFSLAEWQDAIDLAEWLNKVYKEYLVIVSEYSPEQFLAMTQLSVSQGQAIYRTTQEFVDHIITKQQFIDRLEHHKKIVAREQENNVYSG